jgi:hypothetical protein
MIGLQDFPSLLDTFRSDLVDVILFLKLFIEIQYTGLMSVIVEVLDAKAID